MVKKQKVIPPKPKKVVGAKKKRVQLKGLKTLQEVEDVQGIFAQPKVWDAINTHLNSMGGAHRKPAWVKFKAGLRQLNNILYQMENDYE